MNRFSLGKIDCVITESRFLCRPHPLRPLRVQLSQRESLWQSVTFSMFSPDGSEMLTIA